MGCDIFYMPMRKGWAGLYMNLTGLCNGGMGLGRSWMGSDTAYIAMGKGWMGLDMDLAGRYNGGLRLDRGWE